MSHLVRFSAVFITVFVQFFSSFNVFGNDLIVNGKVGIGDSSLAAPLTFENLLGEKIHLYSDRNEVYGLGIQPNTMTLFAPGTNATRKIQLGFRDANANFTPSVTVNQAKLVGIGTSAPTELLHLKMQGPYWGNYNFALEAFDTNDKWEISITNAASQMRFTKNGDASNQIVFLDDGKISAKSYIGSGTTLTFTPQGDIPMFGSN